MSHIKFARNIGVISFINILVALKGVILLPILTKSLSVAQYGVYSQVMISLGLSTPLLTLGLPYALIRFVAGKTHKRDIQESIYSTSLVILAFSIVCSLLLVLFAPFFSNLLKIPPILLNFLAITITLEALNSVFLNTLIAFQKIKTYSWIMLFYIFGEIGFCAFALQVGWGLYGVVLMFMLVRMIAFCIMLTLMITYHGISWPRFTEIKEYLKFGLPATSSNISYWVLASSDRYIIGILLGVLYVGYYSPAYSIGNLLNFFIFPFSLLLPAVLSQQFDHNNTETVKQYLQYSLKYFLLIAIPASFGLSILSRQILAIFSTQDIALHSYFITPFIVVSILSYGIYTFFSQILYLHKKTKLFGFIWLVAAIINMGLNIVFIPMFGLLAAAITTLIAYTLACVIAWWYARKYLIFTIDWSAIAKSILASCVMSAGILAINPVGFLPTMLTIGLGATVYFVGIFLLRTINNFELNILKSLVSRQG